MCEENLNTIIDLDFSVINDEVNWDHDSTNVLQTVDGCLVLNPSDDTVKYRRTLTSSVVENRLRLKINLQAERRNALTSENIEVSFKLIKEGIVIHESTAEISNLIYGYKYDYYLDRTYKIDSEITTPLILEISFPVGADNNVLLKDLVLDQYNYCSDNVRSYFVLDNLLEDSFVSKSAGIQLVSWEVDNTETLTSDFFADNSTVGGTPLTEWNFAKSNLDGSDRIEDIINPNTFNPFVNELGLEYDTITSFHGGKPIGTITGNDYGLGLLELGFEKPAVLNGELIFKKGAFFIDIDYTKNLKIVFNVIVNKNTVELFSSPNTYKEYIIQWNSETCEKSFKYKDLRTPTSDYIDVLEDGFLSGLTATSPSVGVLSCDSVLSSTDELSNTSYVIDYSDYVGDVGINYDCGAIPCRFILEWNGNIYDTGYVGSNSYDTDLINAGVNPININTSSPSNGTGELIISKSLASPNEAVLTVLSPLPFSNWQVNGICSKEITPVLIEVGIGTCSVNPSTWGSAYINTIDATAYIPTNGDIIFADSLFTNPYNGNDNTYKMRVLSSPFYITLNYSFDISTSGVISNVTECVDTGGGNDINILNLSSSECYTCSTVEINVPSGETREVEIISNFAPSGAYGSSFCDGGIGDIVTSDITETITETKTYTIGIDGKSSATGVTGTSTITINTKIGGVLEDSYVISRTHINENC